mmetsp:Transcript_66533/g.195188  ORF Transcript_66533/g.195188 Transcript_66533/m.195188 type:complete len:286 (+) Transcript_66533:775-1632(+)
MHELVDDLCGRATPVLEEEIHVLDAVVNEALLVVLLLVQPHDQAETGLTEDRHVVFGSEGAVLQVGGRHRRGGEGEEPLRDDPVHVAVLHPLEELVRAHVEPLPVVPVHLDCKLQALQAILDVEVPVTRPIGCIPEWKERRVQVSEGRKRCFSGRPQHDDLVCTDEECRVCPSLRVARTEVDQALPVEQRVLHLLVHRRAVPVHHRYVQRTEIVEEGLVHKGIVDAEVVRLGGVLRDRAERDPVEAVRDHLHSVLQLPLRHRLFTISPPAQGVSEAASDALAASP